MRTLACLILLTVMLGGSSAIGGEPTYRVLNSPHAANRYDVRQATPYSYGWFGSGNHTHWKKHYGYHQNYTQWSRR